MSLLPDTTRILLGPGPSLTSPRVMRAMAAPTVSHLDPIMLALLDDVRARLGRLFRAPRAPSRSRCRAPARPGWKRRSRTWSREGTRALVVVTGYFGDRLAQMCERYGATVTRLDVEWGRACDPDALRRALAATPADVVAMVHAETSTGVLNPVAASWRPIAREHGALVLVDAVTSFGGHPLDVGGWGIDACYSCTQKCLGAPSGLAPVVFGPRALERRVPCRSFYFDLRLLQDYWLRRKYHHTMSSTLVYALAEALAIVEEEGPRGALGAARAESSRVRRRPEGARPVAAAAGRRAALDAERRARARTAWTKRRCGNICSRQFNIEIGAGPGTAGRAGSGASG